MHQTTCVSGSRLGEWLVLISHDQLALISAQLPPASSNTKLPDTQTTNVDLPAVQKTATEVQLVFSATKIEELVSSHFPRPAPQGRPNIVRPGQPTEQVTTIRCDCGGQHVEGSMVECHPCMEHCSILTRTDWLSILRELSAHALPWI
jgi:hypothetical protein